MTCSDCKWFKQSRTDEGLCLALPKAYEREADQTACSLFAAKEEKTKIMPYNAIAHLAQRCGEFDARLSALEEKQKGG